MVRPLEFDRQLARGRALRLFWRKGYQAASLNDLTQAMGISRGSFYAAFGDKRSLFLECLDQYAARTLALLEPADGDPAPLTAIRRFFELDVTPPGETAAGLGCLLVNTCLELAGEDAALSARASAYLEEVQAAFEASLIAGGRPPREASELAAVLMLLLEGLRVSGRRALPVEAQRRQVETAFRILGAAQTERQPMETLP